MQKFSGLSVLLVEDEYLIALDAAEILKRLGIEKVVLAATFEAAEKLAAEGEFQAAVLDVNIKVASASRSPPPSRNAAYPSCMPPAMSCAIGPRSA